MTTALIGLTALTFFGVQPTKSETDVPQIGNASLALINPSEPSIVVWSTDGRTYDSAISLDDKRVRAEVQCPATVRRAPKTYIGASTLESFSLAGTFVSEPNVQPSAIRRAIYELTASQRPMDEAAFDRIIETAKSACAKSLGGAAVPTRMSRDLRPFTPEIEADLIPPLSMTAQCVSTEFRWLGGEWLEGGQTRTSLTAELPGEPVHIRCQRFRPPEAKAPDAPSADLRVDPLIVEGRCPLTLKIGGSAWGVQAGKTRYRLLDGSSEIPIERVTELGSKAVGISIQARLQFDGPVGARKTGALHFEFEAGDGVVTKSRAVSYAMQCVGGFRPTLDDTPNPEESHPVIDASDRRRP